MQSGFPGVQFGGLSISFFGLIILAAILVAGLASWLNAQRGGQNPDPVADMVVAGFVASLILGRLFYVLTPPPSVGAYYSREWFLSHPFDLLVGPLAIWSGGLGTAGLLLGGALGVLWVIWRRRLNLWLWLDLLTPGVLLIFVIAPWANLVNQQLLGPPTTLPWGVMISHRVPPFDDLARFPAEARFHPTPAYVSLWALLVFLASIRLYAVLRWKPASGDRFLAAVGLLLPALFFADFLRMDVSRPLLALSGMQLAVLPLSICTATLALHRHRPAVRDWITRPHLPE